MRGKREEGRGKRKRVLEGRKEAMAIFILPTHSSHAGI